MRLTWVHGVLVIVTALAFVAMVSANTLLGGVPSGDFFSAAAAIGFAYGVVGVLISMAMRRGTYPRLMVSGLVAGAIGGAGWITMIWFQRTTAQPWCGLMNMLAAWSLIVGFLGFMHQIYLPHRALAVLRWATIGCGGAMALFVVLMVNWWILEPSVAAKDEIGEWTGRGAGVLGVLTGLGVLLTIVIAAWPQLRHGESATDADRFDVNVACPRCGRRQVVRSHGDACVQCRLRIKVTPA